MATPDRNRLEITPGITLLPCPPTDPAAFMKYQYKGTYLTDGEQITGLNLCGTGIAEAGFLENFPHLEALNLSENKLKKMTVPARNAALRFLNVSENAALQSLDFQGALPDLEKLEASECALKTLELPAGFRALKWLDLSRNVLEKITFRAGCPALEWVDLNGNQLTEFALPEGFGRLEGVFLQKNDALQTPPPAIVKQGAEGIAGYFRQIEEQGGTVELYEAKMIIVGEGKSGKTTLFEKLKDDRHDPIKTPSPETHGVNIMEGLPMRHASLDDEVFHANLWDFGGQDVQYMTHQFFLTPRALYVLLMDARGGSPNLAYWFKIISLLGKAENSEEKVRLLLVFNKRIGDTGAPPLYQDVLKYYKEHLDVSYVEADLAVNEKHFYLVRDRIEELMVTLPIVKSKLPRQWKPIRQALREEATENPYIYTNRLSEICLRHGVTEERDQLQLSDYLHQLGSLLHFQNDENLMDLVILSPKWVVEGAYLFLEEEDIKAQCGKFTKEDFFKILRGRKYTWTNAEGKEQSKNYSSTDVQKILQLMTKNNFDICYEVSKDSGQYVAAQLLPDQAPDYKWLNRSSLQFRYQYPFMPQGLMSRLIVRLSEYIERDETTQEQVVWKKGGVLRIPYNGEECRVRLMEDDAISTSGLREIIIEVLGEEICRKYALQRIRQEVEELHRRWFPSIQADKMVPCCCQKCSAADNPRLNKLNDLLELKQVSAMKQCITGEMVPIQLMLEGVYEKSEIADFERERGQQEEKRGGNVNVHVQVNVSNDNFQKVEYTQVIQNLGISLADFETLQRQIQQLGDAKREALKQEIEALPATANESEKESSGKKILHWLNKSGEAILQNVTASAYYDVVKLLLLGMG